MNDTPKGWHYAELALNKPEENVPVPIVGDASVATRGIADGRLIPVIILDTSRRPDVEDAILAHKSLGPGDVRIYWTRTSRWNTHSIALILNLQQPAACVITIEFDVGTKGLLLDSIIRAQGLYLQGGRPGDRLRDRMDSPRILVEVPSGEFGAIWDGILEKGLIRRFRGDGMSKKDAKARAIEAIARWRTVSSKRMRDPAPRPSGLTNAEADRRSN